MNELLKSISMSLTSQNWYAALFMSLAIPDICAALESSNGKSNKEKYIKWFDSNLAHIYKKEIGSHRREHIFLNGADMYAFRCSMLHQFSNDTKTQKAKDKIGKFKITINNGHMNYNCDVTKEEVAEGDVLQIDVLCFCMEIIEAARKWEKNNSYLLKKKEMASILE